MGASVDRAIERWSDELGGVFSMADLRVVLGDRTDAALYKRLEGLQAAKVLVKVKRGVYATPKAKLTCISHRICPSAYLSTGTVLASATAIGSIPARRVQAVKTGRPRTYRFELGVIEHLSIQSPLYFGFRSEDGILCATPEKAFLDVSYYTFRGKRFSFDPATDINTVGLDWDLVHEYLERYGKRFKSYFNRIWGNR